MNEIVFISGKGGTGKTSFVASFAELCRRSVALGDCDVEAANLALLLRGTEVQADPFVTGFTAFIERDLCTGCLMCMEVCRFGAVRLREDGTPYIDVLSCEGCRACNVVCPPEAIGFHKNRTGEVLQRETRFGPLVHATLGVAQGNSGKLVTKVRQQARDLAIDRGLELILIDGPPGIGCPVHAAIGGANLAVVVTEPTPPGLHDLFRTLELLRHFRIESAVLINKWDLNPPMTNSIERTSRDMGTRQVGRVPFDGRVVMALANGQTPLVIPPVRRALERAWNEIVHTLSETARDGSDAA